MKKIPAIVYFSRNGNTKRAAESLAASLQGETEIFPITPDKKVNGLFGFINAGFSASRGRHWNVTCSYAGNSRLFVLSPIWAGNANPAMLGFLSSQNLSGTEVHIITLQADPAFKGAEKAHEALASAAGKAGGKVVSTAALHSAPPGRSATDAALQGEIERILPRFR